MSDVVITLIGIITLYCGTPTHANPTPCQGTIPTLRAIIPDGRDPVEVCKDQANKLDPNVESHEAFIRVRGAKANATPAWPGAIECSDHQKGKPCVLYPLPGGELVIDGVSNGDGVRFENADDYPELSWKELFGGGTPPALSGKNELAYLRIASGEVAYGTIENMHAAVGATITVKNVPGTTTVMRAGKRRDALKLEIPRSATVDILNLPRFVALSDFAKVHVHNDCDHFFLHYVLTEDLPPPALCPNPAVQHGYCPNRKYSASATIACSNSTYP